MILTNPVLMAAFYVALMVLTMASVVYAVYCCIMAIYVVVSFAADAVNERRKK